MQRRVARLVSGVSAGILLLAARDATALADPPNPTVGTVPATAEAPAVIDVMVLYTRTAEENFRLGAGVPSPPADLALGEIQEALDYVNAALANSGAHVVLDPVHVDCICSSDAPTVYCGSETSCDGRPTLAIGGTDGETLGLLTAPSAGSAPIHTWRDAYGADLVIVVAHGGAVTGIAGWPMQIGTAYDFEAFGVVFPGNTMDEEQHRTFAHEIGHLLGAQHDWWDEGTRLGLYAIGDPPFSPSVASLHGFVHVNESDAGGPGTDSFMTIMAYPQHCVAEGVTCRAVPYFSTPHVLEPQTGLPLGRVGDPTAPEYYDVCLASDPATKTAIDDTSACPADNVAVFDTMGPYIAAYRSTAGPDAKPTSLTVTQHGAALELQWDDPVTTELGFRVYRSTDDGLNWFYLDAVGPNVTTYTDPLRSAFRVDAWSAWRYRVQAYNAAGMTTPAETAIEVVTGCDSVDFDFEPAGGGPCPDFGDLAGSWVNDPEAEPWSIALNPAAGGTCALASFAPPGGVSATSSLTLDAAVSEGFVCFDVWSPSLLLQFAQVGGWSVTGAAWAYGPVRVAVPVSAAGSALRWDVLFNDFNDGGIVYVDDVDLPSPPAAPCGNGVLDAGETCDDGNTTSGDCCSATCAVEPEGDPCDDGRFCTVGPKTCDGTGTCQGTARPCALGECTLATCDEATDACVPAGNVPDDTACDLDGDPCTLDACSAGTCAAGPPRDCGDGDPCTADLCDPGTGTCSHPGTLASPVGVEITASGGTLVVKEAPAGKTDQIKVTITIPAIVAFGPDAGTTGNPTTSGGSAFQFCLLDERSAAFERVYSDGLPAGATCKGKPCCAIRGKPGAETGFRCKDPLGEQGSVRQFSVATGRKGTKWSFVAKRSDLPDLVPAAADRLMAQSDRVVFQLCGTHDTCVTASFPSGARTNVFLPKKNRGSFQDEL